MSRGTLDPAAPASVSCTGLSPSLAGFPKTVPLLLQVTFAVRTPACSHAGLGSSGFARRYFRNRCFFLFLRVLRCFSSPGSPPCAMDLRTDTWGLPTWVSPFRHLRISGYLRLPGAFRSLSRLSSAPSAKASTLRSSSLDLPCMYSVTYKGPGLMSLRGCFFTATALLSFVVLSLCGFQGTIWRCPLLRVSPPADPSACRFL